MRSIRGFTIVELLIVIVVIGILAAVVLNTFTGAQKRARDADRLNDVNGMKRALEVFHADNGYYPPSALMTNITFRRDTLKLQDTMAQPPGSPGYVGYCWSTNPGQYCYVATRPAGSPAGDCTGATELCVMFRISYRTEEDPGTMRILYSNHRD